MNETSPDMGILLASMRQMAVTLDGGGGCRNGLTERRKRRTPPVEWGRSWAMPGSNRRPLPCEGSALPAAPIAHVGFAVTRGDRGLDTSRRSRANAHRGARGLGVRLGIGAREPVSSRHARVSASRNLRMTGRNVPARSAQFVIRSPNPLESLCTQKCGQRGCGAVVAHHLAKVRVASSNLVIRSDRE